VKAIVLLNPTAGALFVRKAVRDIDRVKSAFDAAGIDAEVSLIEGEDLEPAVRHAARLPVDMLVVGGGDGSVSSAAAALIGTQMPLGVLPFGTLNHFARDLGVPFHLDAAVSALAAGHARTIDVADVNGLTFINNSMVGSYPALIDERESHRRHRHVAKYRAGVHALIRVVHHLPTFTVELVGGDTSTTLTTSLLMVGNNRYATGVFGFGRRRSLDAGELCVYAVCGGRRRDAVSSLTRIVLGRPETDNALQAATLTRLTAVIEAPSVRISIDGETRHLRPPLQYAIRPGALRVIVPSTAS
jgi:diacylglycerol kinase family enzyme